MIIIRNLILDYNNLTLYMTQMFFLWMRCKSLRLWRMFRILANILPPLCESIAICIADEWAFFFLRKEVVEWIELAVIYREIHLLRLLQQTLPSIKAGRRWADKYTEGKTWCLLEWEYRIYEKCRGREGVRKGRLHLSEEYIEEHVNLPRNNYPI